MNAREKARARRAEDRMALDELEQFAVDLNDQMEKGLYKMDIETTRVIKPSLKVPTPEPSPRLPAVTVYHCLQPTGWHEIEREDGGRVRVTEIRLEVRGYYLPPIGAARPQ